MRSFRSAARQGEPFWSDHTVTTIKAPPERTGGRLVVAEQLLMAGRQRPARIDPGGDEVLYVLDGIVDALVGSDAFTVERGGMLYVPRGQPLALRVLSQTARMLVIATPAGAGVPRGLVTD